MDQQRFDDLARRLRPVISRRTALGAGLVALAPLAPWLSPVAAEQSLQKTCGPCKRARRKKKRRCKPVANNKRCLGEGRCLAGKCNQPPVCAGYATECFSPDVCCSGNCALFNGRTGCVVGGAGQRCHQDIDCSLTSGSRCVGYRCSQPA